MVLGLLTDAESTTLALAAYLVLDEILSLALGSGACQRLCRQAVRSINLQVLGGKDPGLALRRLVSSSLTDRGQAVRELNACFCRAVTDETLRSLPKLPALQVLNLDGCQDISDEGLLAMAQRCTNLRSLSLYWNVKATDKGFNRLLRAQQDKSLRSLSFSGCKHLSDETVQRIVERGPEVEVLDLTRCPKITDAGTLLVCKCMERLRVLRLYAMAQLSPQAFVSLRELVFLEELDLCGCRIEDGPLCEFLSAAMPSKLHTLNLTWCPALTDAAPLAIARCCPLMEWLSLFGSTNITSVAIEALAAAPCGARIHSLDVRGLTRAREYSHDAARLRSLFPALVNVDLHH